MRLRSRLLLVAGLAGTAIGLAAVLAPAPSRTVAADNPPVIDPDPAKGDHFMFGNGPDRNFANLEPVELSVEFPASPDDPQVHVLGNRVKWKQPLGSRAYGGPIIAGGKVYCGTNNENPRNKRDRGKATDDNPDGPPLDKSVLMCFDEKTGKTSETIPKAGRTMM